MDPGRYTPPTDRPAWQAADKVKASHADAAQRILARQDLSAQGRRRQLAALHHAT